jgi:hypothetical protein
VSAPRSAAATAPTPAQRQIMDNRLNYGAPSYTPYKPTPVLAKKNTPSKPSIYDLMQDRLNLG